VRSWKVATEEKNKCMILIHECQARKEEYMFEIAQLIEVEGRPKELINEGALTVTLENQVPQIILELKFEEDKPQKMYNSGTRFR